jgi:two-component system sensor histidine kinase and response regulator WspE
MHLPVTRSVLRALLVSIAGVPFAFPMARTTGVVRLDATSLAGDAAHPAVQVGDDAIPSVPAADVLEIADAEAPTLATAAVVIGTGEQRIALEVDALLGEVDLVVHPLDRRLGEVPDVAAASTLPDGQPVLLLDVDDLVRSCAAFISGAHATRTRRAATAVPRRTPRVLIVEDSLTVRELERRVLEREGYEVEMAFDGMEGWNAVRLGDYDLVLTDIDMPRLNGLELVRRMRADARLRALPIVIVSYKDRDEDRQRGLEAGADRYLTKSSFQDDSLAAVVRELIGAVAA